MFRHITVMKDEVWKYCPKDAKLIIDGTVWHGWHIQAFFENNILDQDRCRDDKDTWDLSKSKQNKKKLFFGNEIIIKSLVDHGLWFFSGYPMTPASSLIDSVLKYPTVNFFQWEDEIAVSMSMLWSARAGTISACGTSGWGFALMSESISFAYQSEIPWIWIFSQRSWPSTWTPTFTEQWDIQFALCPTFGWVRPIVISLSDFVYSYYLIWKAIDLAWKYQHPLIILTEKQFSEWYVWIDLKLLKKHNFDIKNISDPNLPRYQITESWISNLIFPGTENCEFASSSYEHDEYGVTTEDPDTKIKMTDKRKRKMQTFMSEFDDNFVWFEITNPDAESFFISTWFVRYAILSAIKDNSNKKTKQKRWHIDIQVLQPLSHYLEKFLKSKKIKKLVFVEMNADWQLEKHIVNEVRLYSFLSEKQIERIRKYDLYPISQEDISDKINNLI